MENRSLSTRRRIVLVLCAALVALSAAMLIRRHLDTQKTVNNAQKAVEIASAPTKSDTPRHDSDGVAEPVQQEIGPDVQMLLDMDLDALRAVNPDVVGWLYVPDTDISYPVVQGDTNQDYLRTAWDGTADTAGSIFLDAKSSPGFTDLNSVIYGHRMKNGTMFAGLKNFMDADYAQDRLAAYVRTDEGVNAYLLFSGYVTGKSSRSYDTTVTGDTYGDWASWCESKNETYDVSGGTAYDEILTLSTCGDNSKTDRIVVQYKLCETYPLPD